MSNEANVVEKYESKQETPVSKVEKRSIRPVTDVYRDEEAVRLIMDLPGATEDTVDVSVHDGHLLVRAEVNRSETEMRVYERSFQMDRRMDSSKIEAVLKSGVLSLRIPFHEEALPKRIQVRAS